MKKESSIDNNINLSKNIIAITVGLLTIITLSIGIGVYFGRNAAFIEMNKTERQSNK